MSESASISKIGVKNKSFFVIFMLDLAMDLHHCVSSEQKQRNPERISVSFSASASFMKDSSTGNRSKAKSVVKNAKFGTLVLECIG